MIIQLLNQRISRLGKGRSHFGKKWAIALGEEMGDRIWGRNGRSPDVRKRTKIEVMLKSRLKEKYL
ncbi:MAG: hypothetical protein JGK17_29115 [Microcoleus sp. PH2017_10_PVI_O_A]|uniref:hypothetical protein n=1 Tax=unclassified Microcoleus TaxID=2642155 RepID=UPI001DDC515B|nr:MULTISPECIES: hypothetical protein [unclassified Microcoleus]TAE75057.1 MAG: hypothetical protein EAZ83_29650 [Oscillatoriales cyanobacterium]MCC3409542.1 hypothetical protein [Microcoleus sp. PH2017_10_PVI_O_A]MCC3463779.1 hypothetical protein [Microcoleus sp. PH2017_11_PCY_U_A]MCC3482130.1 hypothetical protein [Microcoleus sp. PH2017_12_PCY_D_A]MCC3531544.1 hypothetical protein [Microcoleus sp. PH2017_21_RUC_O_A]